ncbi:MAG: hypothetical protein ACE5LB_08085 [Acidiferrobacterales bacterium]
MMQKVLGQSLLAGLLLTFPFATLAQDSGDFWMAHDRMSLNVGGFLAEYTTDIRLTTEIAGRRIGTKISLENDLALAEDDTVIRIDGYYRFKPRHRIDYSFFDLSREGATVTRRPLIFGDTFFPRGTPIVSEFDLTIYKVAYTYSFFQRRKLDLGFSAGVYGLDVEGGITAPGTNLVETDEAFAPFPVVGLRATYAFSHKLFFNASFQYFEINEDEVDGEVIDILAAVEYKASKHVGIGTGFNSLDLEAQDKEDKDEIDLKYSGLLVYAKFYW